MANMKYCIFENTYKDTLDCFDELLDKEVEELSESEQKYARKLIELCKKIVDEFWEE